MTRKKQIFFRQTFCKIINKTVLVLISWQKCFSYNVTNLYLFFNCCIPLLDETESCYLNFWLFVYKKSILVTKFLKTKELKIDDERTENVILSCVKMTSIQVTPTFCYLRFLEVGFYLFIYLFISVPFSYYFLYKSNNRHYRVSLHFGTGKR